MKKKVLWIVLFSLVLLANSQSPAGHLGLFHQGIPHRPLAGGAFVPGQLVVKLASAILGHDNPGRAGRPVDIESHPERVLKARYRDRVQAVDRDRYCGYYVVKAAAGCDLEVLKTGLLEDPLIQDVSYNYLASITRQAPNDPMFNYQYALSNQGQVYEPALELSGQTGSDIKALDGWDWSTGAEEAVIAVIDTGVALDHEDLAGKVIPGYNFVADNDNPYDDHGHGTFVSSIAAAASDNGLGIAGVCWKGKIMSIKVADATGIAPYLTIAAGIRYAADHGAQVLNMSLGGMSSSFILEDACQYAYEKGCVIVASSGNYGGKVLYPAAYDDYCLAVAATDAHDQVPAWSNFGPQVDVAAPGFFVLGARYLPATPLVLNAYGWGSGTSFSAPQVAGAAALLIGYKPFLTNGEVMALIKYTAADINADTLPGEDDDIGYGRLDLKTLLAPFELD